MTNFYHNYLRTGNIKWAEHFWGHLSKKESEKIIRRVVMIRMCVTEGSFAGGLMMILKVEIMQKTA